MTFAAWTRWWQWLDMRRNASTIKFGKKIFNNFFTDKFKSRKWFTLDDGNSIFATFGQTGSGKFFNGTEDTSRKSCFLPGFRSPFALCKTQTGKFFVGKWATKNIIEWIQNRSKQSFSELHFRPQGNFEVNFWLLHFSNFFGTFLVNTLLKYGKT